MKTTGWSESKRWKYRYILKKNGENSYDFLEFKHQGESYYAWGTDTVGGKWNWYPVDEDRNVIGPPADGLDGDEWWMWFVTHSQQPLPEGLI